MKLISKRHLIYILLIIAIPVVIYLVSAGSYITKCSVVRPSCLDHRKASCGITGDYTVGIAGKTSEVTCDMETDQGGWTLAANYLHRQAAPGAPVVLPNGVFPLQKKHLLGLDEVGTPSWGHASNATLATVPFKEVRFRCMTTAHQRLIDFSVTSEACVNYIRTGIGSCLSSAENKSELVKSARSLAGNGARLPEVADKGWKDQGDFAMVNYPFFLDYKNHWAIGRLPGRFECDDYDSGGTASTWHQVWVR